MASEAKVSRFGKWWSWVVPGAAFTGACIYSIQHSEFIPRLAVLGSLVLLALWAVTGLVFWLLKMRPAEHARIRSPGLQIHLFFVGAIIALWFPLALKPLQAQKVEIILDVSQRMAEDFIPAGTTKFDAAKAGVLEVLTLLEGNNMEVALRLINGIEYGRCDIQPETSLAVDFTRDFDKIRQVLRTLRPRASEPAPVVNAIDFSIDHYLDKRIFDQKFFLYSFIGGDDTCGGHLGTYLNLPMVMEHAVNTQLFLIVLRDTDEAQTLGNLPNANLTYAESAAEVLEIVETYNNIIVTPTPAPTRPGSLAYASTGTSTPTETPLPASEQIRVTDKVEPNEPVREDQAPDEPGTIGTPDPPAISSPIIIPSPTRVPPTPTPLPPPNPPTTPPSIPTEFPTDPPTEIPATDTPSPTATPIPPTRTPTQTAIVCLSTRTPLAGTTFGGTVTIDGPGFCSTTHSPGTPINTTGTYTGIPQGTVIWVFVYPPNGPYYPQSPNACSTPIAPPPAQSAGTWNVPSYLGDLNDPPKPFDIVVALADQATSNWIGGKLHEDCVNGDYDGISAAELSQKNIDEKDSITVWTR